MKKNFPLIVLSLLVSTFVASQPKSQLEFRIAKMIPTEGYQKTKTFATGQRVFIKKDSPIIIQKLKSVKLEESPIGKPTGIFMELTQEDAEKFAQLTEENIEGHVAIIIDHKVLSTPEIKEKFSGGSIYLNRGYLTDDEIRNMATNFVIESADKPVEKPTGEAKPVEEPLLPEDDKPVIEQSPSPEQELIPQDENKEPPTEDNGEGSE